jgi:alpha-1,3-rhamnosyl/mannosyltransferase
MPDLAINGIDLGRGRGGNESYMQGLIQGLKAVDAVQNLYILVGSHFRSKPASDKVHYIQTGTYNRVAYLLWMQTSALRKVRYDWYLSTFFLPAINPRNNALFVHDLSFRTLPNSYPVSIRLYMRWLVSWAVHRADILFVLSNFIRDEFFRYYPHVAKGRLKVLYPGIDACFSSTPEPSDAGVLALYNLTPGYILTVSSIHPRKNLSGLLTACRLLKQNPANSMPPLVVVGQRYWGSSALESEAPSLGVRLLGYVPQNHLPSLYRGARIFVYPSLYEGFGLPPVEALACGVPVICDGGSSLPEAVDSAAEFADMRNPQDISRAVHNLLLSDDIRSHLVCKGLDWVKRFNWQHTAEQLVHDLTELAA